MFFQYFLLTSLFTSVLAQVNAANAAIDRRDNASPNSNTDPSTTTSITASPSSSSQTSNTGSGAAASTSSSSSRSDSGSANPTTTSPSSSTPTSHQQPLTTAKTIAQNAPAGGISLIQPVATTTTYYKVGDQITFIWDYTSLLAPPSAINLIVSNTASTYTLTQNASVVPTATYVWDTNQYAGQQNPLLNAFYTMAVCDAANACTALPKPGHLGSNGYNPPFGIYATQSPAVPIDVVQCVTCGAAATVFGGQTVRLMAAMAGGLVMWFAYI